VKAFSKQKHYDFIMFWVKKFEKLSKRYLINGPHFKPMIMVIPIYDGQTMSKVHRASTQENEKRRKFSIWENAH
jgi:hypothetical protein